MQQTFVGKGQKRTHAKRYVTFYSLDYKAYRERKNRDRGIESERGIYIERERGRGRFIE